MIQDSKLRLLYCTFAGCREVMLEGSGSSCIVVVEDSFLKYALEAVVSTQRSVFSAGLLVAFRGTWKG